MYRNFGNLSWAVRVACVVLVIAATFSTKAYAQASTQATPDGCIGVQAPDQTAQADLPAVAGASDKAADNKSDKSAADKSAADKDFHMTPQQAKELFSCVDTIMKFASDDTNYPIVRSVKRKLVTRDSVQSYLLKKFDEDKGAKKMEQSELVLKKFGLLNQDFALRPFLLSLLTEQIAGYYDDQTRTVNLLDWIPPDEQKPVMAHELTHALQDQHSPLKKWESQTLTTISRNAADDNAHIATDEVDDTRDAVLEGQAMAVFVDYGLKPMGRSIVTAPEVVNNVVGAMGDTTGSPVMARAPLMLQETLVFPYSAGLGFTAAVLHARGPDHAFAGVMDAPPSSSFEIMHPDAYLAHVPVPVLHMADIHPLIDKDYLPYDVGVMGSLDVRILTELFGGESASDALTPAWDGGLYYAAQRRSATDAEKKTTASLALIYYSRWKNEDSARSFLRVYVNNLPRKYSQVKQVKADAGAPEATAEYNEVNFTTNEGDVLLVQKGRSVFIAEGFDRALAHKLFDSITLLQSDGPMQIASGSMLIPTGMNGELSGHLSDWIGSMGLMKIAIRGIH
jgi:hypothetical protein